MQNESWELEEELGSSMNCTVYACRSLQLPGVVLKRGVAWQLQEEARLHWLVHHPNVATLYGQLSSPDLDEGEQVGYLALERLACTLKQHLADHKTDGTQ